jgi:DNA-binding HxlR family transcriptional regulator
LKEKSILTAENKIGPGTVYQNMSTNHHSDPYHECPHDVLVCPAEDMLKILAGKWKPQIFRLAAIEPVRFNSLLRRLPGANKQSLSVALKDLEDAGILTKKVIAMKPLHIEYTLTERGKAAIPVFKTLNSLPA